MLKIGQKVNIILDGAIIGKGFIIDINMSMINDEGNYPVEVSLDFGANRVFNSSLVEAVCANCGQPLDLESHLCENPLCFFKNHGFIKQQSVKPYEHSNAV